VEVADLQVSANADERFDRSLRHELIQELDHGRQQPFEQDAGIKVQHFGQQFM
jgi:hypothetical protein